MGLAGLSLYPDLVTPFTDLTDPAYPPIGNLDAISCPDRFCHFSSWLEHRPNLSRGTIEAPISSDPPSCQWPPSRSSAFTGGPLYRSGIWLSTCQWLYHSPAFIRFFIFRTVRSRLSGLNLLNSSCPFK